VQLISCTANEGIGALLQRIQALVAASVYSGQSSQSAAAHAALVTRNRHRTLLEEARDNLDSFLERPNQLDLAAEELRNAMHAIGQITGRIDVEGLLDRIFREFCIGK